ncbi:schwannomin-interacting protein 1 isoform X1 [Polyodon spathula]|uniref:schwannomin-interacting protein 1 isoform X1 n=1 Tax=Polyodon spathula TaxID=7913 RepID=UPI001B7DCE13|nr:schwannomin-interacting protein 1 isoform X1 [Polyodon spathula]
MEGDKEGKEREGEEKECDEAELSSDQAESRTASSHSPLGSSLEDLASPIMHWEALGHHIEELERQEQQRERGRRREEREGKERERGKRGPQPGELRREPARLSHRQSVKAQWEEQVEEEGGDEEITKHVSELTSRLKSRMNLQLCFINNSESEEEEEEEEERGKERGKLFLSPLSPPQNPAGSTGGRVPAVEAPPPALVARGDRVERQREVETEARRALARVRERLAKRPERGGQNQSNKSLAHTPDDRRLQSADLHTLTIKQLDTLRKRLIQAVQDLSSELVGLLLSRDQLQTEQDAILLEVEDLTAFAEKEQTHQHSTPR